MRNTLLVLGFSAFAAAGCASDQKQPAGVASAGCQQLGNVNEIVASQLQPGQVIGAREVREQIFLARALQPERTVGADLYVLATPNSSPQYLERTLTCHAAQGQALGANDPFHPSEGYVTDVSVRPVSNGYAVRVRGSNPEAAKEIWQRAQRFADPGAVTVEQVAENASNASTL
jgi:hypothetical protein